MNRDLYEEARRRQAKAYGYIGIAILIGGALAILAVNLIFT